MKIKIIQKGWATYSDLLCGVKFVDGVSERDVTERECDSIAAILQVESIEGKQVGTGQRSLDMNKVTIEDLGVSVTLPKTEASVEEASTTVEQGTPVETAEPASEATVSETPAPEAQPAAVTVSVKIWTEQELSDVADKEGVSGLRAIGDTLDVKGRAIRELISGILDAQKAGK